MPISKVANVVTYSDKNDKWSSGKTGVFEAQDFAIADSNNALKQIQFDPSAIADNTTITLAAPAQNGTLAVSGYEVIQYSAPSTGASVTIAPATSTLILEPAGTIATLTLLLPAAADGKSIIVTSSQIVTALTITAAGSDSVVTQTTALAAGVAIRYVARSTKWYKS